MQDQRRTGISLVELLVVIGILAVLLALLLPAVQNVREAAIRMRSANTIKQVCLGFQNYASANGDRLPLKRDGGITNSKSNVEQIAAYLELDYGRWSTALVSAADPSIAVGNPVSSEKPSSFPINSQVFHKKHVVSLHDIRDGLSNTLFVGEGYAYCDTWARVWDTGSFGFTTRNSQESSFGFGGYDYPIPTAAWLMENEFGDTFQVRPLPIYYEVIPEPKPLIPGSCGYRLAQTAHTAGMLVGLGDGSVRTLKPTITPIVYWSAITPAGGEVLDDW